MGNRSFEDVLASASHLKEDERACLSYSCDLAQKIYGDHRRRNGELWTSHAMAVAIWLAERKAPCDVLSAALLHDVKKDRFYQNFLALKPQFLKLRHAAHIEERINNIFELERVTQIDSLEAGYSLQKNERITPITRLLKYDPLAIVIKIADRIDQFSTHNPTDDEQMQAGAISMLNLFAPAARRLGMAYVQYELQDKAFKTLKPAEYARVKEFFNLENFKHQNRHYIEALRACLEKSGVSAQKIDWDPISYYTLSERIQQRSQDFPIVSAHWISIVVNDNDACYSALGALHQRWTYQTGEFLDFISRHRPNLYAALHTKISYGADEATRVALSVSIRSARNDKIANHGILCNWLYPDEFKDAPFRPIVLKKEWTDPNPGQIIVYTPDNTPISITEGATALDLAYRIHSDIGNRCAKIYINGKNSPLNTPLQSGDNVEVISDPFKFPEENWESFVVTKEAKKHISFALKNAQNAVEKLNLAESQPLVVPDGQFSLLSKAYAHCCNPQPPFPIKGLLTSQQDTGQRVIEIHRADCKKVKSREKFVAVEWSHQINDENLIEFTVIARDRIGLARDICDAVAQKDLNISRFIVRELHVGLMAIHLRLAVSTSDQTALAIQTTLKEISSVINVYYNEISQITSNPFTILPATGTRFVGRQKEIQQLADAIFEHRALGLVAPRRLGKTSLAYALKEDLASHESRHPSTRTIIFDLSELSSQERNSIGLLHGLTLKIEDSIHHKDLKAPSLKILASDPIAILRGFLKNALRLSDARLLFVFDETLVLKNVADHPALTVNQLGETIRHLIQDNSDTSLWGNLYFLFLFGGHSDIASEVIKKFNDSLLIKSDLLDVLSDDDALRLLALNRNLRLDKDCERSLLDLSGRHPYFLQHLCIAIQDMADPSPGLVTYKRIQRQIKKFITDQDESLFHHQWGSNLGLPEERVAKLKRVFLTINAIAKQNQNKGWAAQREIANALSVLIPDSSDIDSLLTELYQLRSVERRRRFEYEYRLRFQICRRWAGYRNRA